MKGTDMYDPWLKFIERERERLGITNDNFPTAFEPITRYYIFLEIIKNRYSRSALEEKKETEFVLRHVGVHGEIKERPPHTAAERTAMVNELHLDIESYFLFSRILLDRIAAAVEIYFGVSPMEEIDFKHGIKDHKCYRINSHHLFSQNLGRYVKERGLVVSRELVLIISELQSKIAHVRNKRITHEENLRLRPATLSTDGGESTIIHSVYGYKQGDDRDMQPYPPIKKISELITKYLDLVGSFIESNRVKNALQGSGQLDS